MSPELVAHGRDREGWLRAIVAALIVSVLLLAVILGTTTATFGPATLALALALGVLLVALRSLFGIVQVLAVPDAQILDVGASEALAGSVGSVALRDEHRRVLRAINDLAFEHSMGKISDADHLELSTAYRLRAIELMRALDKDLEVSEGLRATLAQLGVILPSKGAGLPVEAEPSSSAAPEPDAEASSEPGTAISAPAPALAPAPVPVPTLTPTTEEPDGATPAEVRADA